MWRYRGGDRGRLCCGLDWCLVLLQGLQREKEKESAKGWEMATEREKEMGQVKGLELAREKELATATSTAMVREPELEAGCQR